MMMITMILTLILTGDYTSAMTPFLGEEDSHLVDLLLTFSEVTR